MAEVTADVVIIGFGAAGACAAIEAARAGADVVVLDRFAGGGATRLSGGVVYAVGGTPQQGAAGVSDSPQCSAASSSRHESTTWPSPCSPVTNRWPYGLSSAPRDAR